MRPNLSWLILSNLNAVTPHSQVLDLQSRITKMLHITEITIGIVGNRLGLFDVPESHRRKVEGCITTSIYPSL